MVIYVGVLAVLILFQRLAELAVAEKNRRSVIKAGAVEFGAIHYPLFVVLHTGWLVGWIFEACSKGVMSDLWYLWLTIYMLAQGLRYWCIVSLGTFWNTRILVIPGGQLVSKGPYRYFAHPNYIAVALELCCVPLIFDAAATAVLASLANALLMAVRIPEEERALKLLQPPANNN